ncbi:hypothetical protein NDU88_003187 [Pleurodeles waltl]|uniref:Uncharacterized protein n=1 Tax=Pleurodeles waltl TaxID=8319 RepID=A0AAV7KXS1_PLEWA|nr:hypothetical protein NDU88_003187 [Pleurodeles waltl]
MVVFPHINAATAHISKGTQIIGYSPSSQVMCAPVTYFVRWPWCDLILDIEAKSQAYFKKPGSIGKFAFLKKPTAASYSNSDDIEGLLTPFAPQIFGSVRMQHGASIDRTSSINPASLAICLPSDQRSKLKSPLQKSADKQSTSDLDLDLDLEQPVGLQDMRIISSNASTQKKPQANSTLIKALVHVPTTTMAHSIGQRNTQLITTTTDNPHGLQLPIVLDDQSEEP